MEWFEMQNIEYFEKRAWLSMEWKFLNWTSEAIFSEITILAGVTFKVISKTSILIC